MTKTRGTITLTRILAKIPHRVNSRWDYIMLLTLVMEFFLL